MPSDIDKSKKDHKAIGMKILLALILVFLFILAAFYLWASSSSLKSGWYLGEMKGETEEVLEKNELQIISWNMAYAHGIGSEGVDYQRHSKEKYLENLASMAKYINENKADIVLLQEIDFGSARTYFIDQLEFLSQNTELKYRAYAPTWDNQYIPFPYWPVSKHFGKMNSGGAILSRYPIVDNQVFLFNKPLNNPFWYNAFYLHRFFQAVKVEINNKQFYVGNLHIEAFDKEARMSEAKKIIELKKELSSVPWLLIGGDFNSTPSYASKRSSFDGYEDDDYENDRTIDILEEGLEDLAEVVSREEYLANEKDWFTFATNDPNRRLDYFFVNKSLNVLEKKVGDSTVSDHFPLMMKVKVD